MMIPVAEPWIGERELEYVTDCIRSGWASSIGKMHTMPPYKNKEEVPVAEEISRKGINLPSGVCLIRENIERITGRIRRLRWP